MKRVLLLFSLLFPFFIHAQALINVSGTVTSKDDNRPLEGISVSLSTNKSVGTTTNTQGRFMISVPSNSTLIFSGVGFKRQEVRLGSQILLSISLESEYGNLDDVVVVGFGTQTRKTLTGAVSKVKGEDIANMASTNFQSTLQGTAPGLNVTNTSGLAGAPVRVRIRGNGSIFSNGEPLYVIDGVPVDADNSGLFANTNRGGAPPANPMANIDPDDIESLEILKDAAASAIFGARAANGVILVTTKKGKTGKTKFSANVSFGTNSPTNRVEYINGNDYLSLRKEAIANSQNTGIIFNGTLGGIPAAFVNGGYNQWFANALPALSFDSSIAASVASQNINHFDDIFRRGSSISTAVSASGGNEKTTFFTSLSFNQENGFLIRNDFQRINGRINIDHNATSKLKIGVQASGSFTKNSLFPIGPPSLFANGFNPLGFSNATNSILPIFPRLNTDGSLFGVPQSVNNLIFQDENLFNNNVNQQRYLTNVYADLKVSKNLSFRSEWGNDHINQFTRFYMSPDITPGGQLGTIRGINDFRTRIGNTLNANNFFTYKQTFNKIHNIDVVAGYQYTYNNSRSSQIRVSNIPSAPTLNTTQVGGVVDGASDRLDQFLYTSFFSRINYNISRKYLFGASFRRDGSSRFGENYRWANFPSFSAGWVISDEEFIKNVKAVNLLKLRASWGLTGNSNPGGVEPINFGGFGVGNAFYGGSIGYPFRRIQALSENIRWERTQMFDLGLDFGLFSNKISGSVNYYERKTTGLILGSNPMPGTGIIGGRNFLNIGSLNNWGIEFALNAKIITNKNFNWQAEANISYNQNKVISTGGIDPTLIAFGVNRVFPGMPLSTYWMPMFLGVDPATGFPVYAGRLSDNSGVNIPDKNGFPQHDPNNRIIVDPFGRINGTTTNVNWENISAPIKNKPGQPLWTGGLTNTFAYKGITLSVLLTYSLGNWIYDQGAQSQAYMLQINRNVQQRFIENRWQKPGDVAENPGFFYNPAYSNQATTQFLYNGDFVRLRNLRLSYALPKTIISKLGLERASVFFNATNLLTLTKFKGWDPEVSGTLSFQDFNSQPQNIAASQTNADPPQARNISFGVQINF